MPGVADGAAQEAVVEDEQQARREVRVDGGAVRPSVRARDRRPATWVRASRSNAARIAATRGLRADSARISRIRTGVEHEAEGVGLRIQGSRRKGIDWVGSRRPRSDDPSHAGAGEDALDEALFRNST